VFKRFMLEQYKAANFNSVNKSGSFGIYFVFLG